MEILLKKFFGNTKTRKQAVYLNLNWENLIRLLSKKIGIIDKVKRMKSFSENLVKKVWKKGLQKLRICDKITNEIGSGYCAARARRSRFPAVFSGILPKTIAGIHFGRNNL